LIEVDVCAAIMENRNFRPLDGVEKLQIILLAKLAILVAGEQILGSPAIGGVEDAAGPILQAGQSEGGEGLGDDAQG